MHRKAHIVSAEANLAYVEGYLTEDEPLLAARREAAQIGGAPPIGPGGGAALCFIAAAISARSVVEIGTGCGTSGIWLLRGMRPDAVLTSVDAEPEHQRLARKAFTEAGFPSNRYRLISGKALDVLPRLTDGAYDLVFCDADKQEYPDYLVEGAVGEARQDVEGLPADQPVPVGRESGFGERLAGQPLMLRLGVDAGQDRVRAHAPEQPDT
jgi:predicted O-methyltransferase YrrM